MTTKQTKVKKKYYCPRPKTLQPELGWCGKPHHGVFFDKDKGCDTCKRIADRKAKGLCCAQLFHGPGHQSRTYCQETGDHKVHRCRYGSYDELAEWRGPQNRRKFTGYFDEPPYIDE